LIQGFAELKDIECLEDWKVVLIGTGAHEVKLKKLIANLGLEEKVNILSPMPREIVLSKMEKTGLLFMNLMPDKVFKLTIPSKVFEYMLAGRPILAGIAGEGKSIIEATGGNVCFEPGSVEAFKEALVRVSSELSFYEEKASQNLQYVHSRYTREQSVSELNKVFEDVMRASF
jgi:glycosyltransferase involved in cell wall biosynthesis